MQARFSAPQIDEGFVLVLGAGVNGADVPKWDELVGELLRSALSEHGVPFTASSDSCGEGCDGGKPTGAGCRKPLPTEVREIQANFDLYAQASLVEALYGPERLRSRLAALLYAKHDTILKEGALLTAVARLCGTDPVRAVLTFNYDTYLEEALGEYPFITIDCMRRASGLPAAGASSAKSLPIYHVHGLIPGPGGLLRSPGRQVVLSQGDYLSLFGQPESEATSTSLHLLRSYPAIFIGCSLKDWNMIRLLQRSGRRSSPGGVHSSWPHYCLVRSLRSGSGDADGGLLLDRLRAKLWATLGVRPVYFPEFADIAVAIDKLAEAAPRPGKGDLRKDLRSARA